MQVKEKIPEILSKGGFKITGFVATGDEDDEAHSLPGGKDVAQILGISWHPKSDEFSVQVKINMSKKQKGARVEEDMKVDEIPRLIEIKTMRKILLEITNSIYDVYGLIPAILIQLKVELRSRLDPVLKLGWDDSVPTNIKGRWIKLLQLLKSVEGVRFRSCIKPKDAVGKPILIVCSDGDITMCTTAHVRWEMRDGSFQCCLFAAKTRVTPLRKETTPRIEMQSCVMGARLAKTIKMYSGLVFAEVYNTGIDSMCTLQLSRMIPLLFMNTWGIDQLKSSL